MLQILPLILFFILFYVILEVINYIFDRKSNPAERRLSKHEMFMVMLLSCVGSLLMDFHEIKDRIKNLEETKNQNIENNQ